MSAAEPAVPPVAAEPAEPLPGVLSFLVSMGEVHARVEAKDGMITYISVPCSGLVFVLSCLYKLYIRGFDARANEDMAADPDTRLDVTVDHLTGVHTHVRVCRAEPTASVCIETLIGDRDAVLDKVFQIVAENAREGRGTLIEAGVSAYPSPNPESADPVAEKK